MWLEGFSVKKVRKLLVLVMKRLILTGWGHLCVVAVTLLDSMSALADLGWEAYPNEGVSMSHTDTHTHTHNSFTQKEDI